MSTSDKQFHHYDYNGNCMFCKKPYEPNSVDWCPGYTLPETYRWSPKCECGSKALLPSDQNCHSVWCPAYKKN